MFISQGDSLKNQEPLFDLWGIQGSGNKYQCAARSAIIFVVDEMGAPVKSETRYGIYSSDIRIDGDRLVLERTLQWNKAEVPPEEFGDLVEFYEGIVSAEKTPVVLIRG